MSDATRLAQYRAGVAAILVSGNSATSQAAREELTRGLRGLLGRDVPVVRAEARQGIVLAGTPSTSRRIAALGLRAELAQAGEEGYVIRSVTAGGS